MEMATVIEHMAAYAMTAGLDSTVIKVNSS